MSPPADAAPPVAPDLDAVKERQQKTWASGDFSVVASRIVFQAEHLCEAANLQAGWRVLDVATGSGNAAIAAARRGCEVVGIDYVPALLERARRRRDAEGLDAQFIEGDAEALPYANGQFDVVSSVFGAMFAPDQERTADELTRVTRSGGRIGLASWTPEGFIGQYFKTNAKHVPPPAGVRSPLQWGTSERIGELFGDVAAEIRLERRFYAFRARSPQAWIEDFRRYYGPTLKSFEAVGEAGREALENDLLELIAHFNRAVDGTMVVPSEYLEVVLVKA